MNVLALERIAGRLITEIYVLKAWAAWRSMYATKEERARRAAQIRANHDAVKAIHRKIRRSGSCRNS